MLIGIFRIGGAEFAATEIGSSLATIANYGIFINLILAYFNLLPIPPLDGSHVMYHLLPPRLGAQYRAMGRYGVTLLFFVVVLFPGVLSSVLAPVFVIREFLLALAIG